MRGRLSFQTGFKTQGEVHVPEYDVPCGPRLPPNFTGTAPASSFLQFAVDVSLFSRQANS